MTADTPPPPGFRGLFTRDESTRRSLAGASGPFWHLPAAVAAPVDADDVERLVGWAADSGTPLVPRGGGSGMPGGNVGPWVVVDLRELDDIGPVEALPDGRPAIRAGAGAVAGRVRQAAERQAPDHTLAALPSSAPWCTVGGVVACNGAGARSFRHGAARAWTASLEWVRGDGTRERLTAGDPSSADAASPYVHLRDDLSATLPDPLPWPRVRKNSSGYALDRFLPTGQGIDLAVGSEGTLGIVTEATWVLQPVPQVTALALLGVPALEAVPGMAASAGTLDAVTACEYLGRRLVELGGLASDPVTDGLRTRGGLVLMEVAGSADEVADALGRVERLGRPGGIRIARDAAGRDRLWEVRHAASPSLARALEEGKRSTQFIEDSVVPVESLPDYIRGLTRILDRHDTDAVLFGHAGDGNLHVNPLVPLSDPGWRDRVGTILEETVELVAELGGTLAGEHGDGRVRTPYLDRIFPPAVIGAFAAVKAHLDPAAILNPGVVVPGPGSPDPLAGLGEAPGFHTGSQGPERGHR